MSFWIWGYFGDCPFWFCKVRFKEVDDIDNRGYYHLTIKNSARTENFTEFYEKNTLNY